MSDTKDLIERLRYDHILDCGCQKIQDDAADEIERLEDILNQITKWYRAYPRASFSEPTKEQWLEAHNLLNKAKGCSLSAISASRVRHVLGGIGKIIDKEQPSKADQAEKEIVSSESNN